MLVVTHLTPTAGLLHTFVIGETTSVSVLGTLTTGTAVVNGTVNATETENVNLIVTESVTGVAPMLVASAETTVEVMTASDSQRTGDLLLNSDTTSLDMNATASLLADGTPKVQPTL